MERRDEGRPTVEELYGVLERQGERIDALEATLRAVLRAPEPARAPRDSRLSRAVFLKTGAAVLAGGAVVGTAAAEPAPAEAAAHGIVGSWIVTVAYVPGPQRTRGLATFTTGGGFVGSISAYEQAPAQPTPSRGTTLHGTWRRAKGRRAYEVSAVRLHLDAAGTLIGVMSTQIVAKLASSRDSWHGSFTFEAATPDGQVFKRGKGTLRGVRVK